MLAPFRRWRRQHLDERHAGLPGGLATPKPRSRNRTSAYPIRSMRTLHFLLLARADRLARIGGCHVLRLSPNPATEVLYGTLDHRLAP